MNRMSRQQKDKVSQFRTITGARCAIPRFSCSKAVSVFCAAVAPSTSSSALRSDKIAVDCLKASQWVLENGIDHFYQSGLQASTPNVDPRLLDSMFQRYKGEWMSMQQSWC